MAPEADEEDLVTIDITGPRPKYWRNRKTPGKRYPNAVKAFWNRGRTTKYEVLTELRARFETDLPARKTGFHRARRMGRKQATRATDKPKARTKAVREIKVIPPISKRPLHAPIPAQARAAFREAIATRANATPRRCTKRTSMIPRLILPRPSPDIPPVYTPHVPLKSIPVESISSFAQHVRNLKRWHMKNESIFPSAAVPGKTKIKRAHTWPSGTDVVSRDLSGWCRRGSEFMESMEEHN